MSYTIGGLSVPSTVVSMIEYRKEQAEQAVVQKIHEVIQDPAKNVRELQQPSGLSTFLDIKV